jgi:4-hydroxybenzoate polyprenyltransferase
VVSAHGPVAPAGRPGPAETAGLLLRCGSCRYAGWYLLAYLEPAAHVVPRPAPVVVLCGAAYVVVLGLAGELSNRYADQTEDRINNPERTALCDALGYRRIRAAAVVCWIVLVAVSGALVALRPSVHLAAVLLVYGTLGYAYSFGPRIKRRPLLAVLTLTQPFTAPFLVALALAQSERWLSPGTALVAVILAALPLGVIGMKDLTDVHGDRAIGYRSLWIRLASAVPRALPALTASLPAALVVVGVLAGLVPARMALALALSPLVMALVAAGARATGAADQWAAREAMYYLLFLFAATTFVLFYASWAAVVVAVATAGYWIVASRTLHWRRTIGRADLRRLGALLRPRRDSAPRARATGPSQPEAR